MSGAVVALWHLIYSGYAGVSGAAVALWHLAYGVFASSRAAYDAGRVANWLAAFSASWFVIEYSLLARWWRNPVGRSIVWLDFVLMADLAVVLAYPVPFRAFAYIPRLELWLSILNAYLVSVVLLSRSVTFWRLHRSGDLGAHGNSPGPPIDTAEDHPARRRTSGGVIDGGQHPNL